MTDKEKLLRNIEEEIKSDRSYIYAYRLAMVYLLLNGMPVSILEQYAGRKRRRLEDWVRMADEQPLRSLMPERTPSARMIRDKEMLREVAKRNRQMP